MMTKFYNYNDDYEIATNSIVFFLWFQILIKSRFKMSKIASEI
jgi:hypothetical protein